VKPLKQSALFDCLAMVLERPARASGETEEALVTEHSCDRAARQQYRLLVAEDVIANQKVIEHYLTKWGFACDVAVNGQEVLELMARNRYDLVLMDCQMPEKDGYETTREIRRCEGAERHTPVIAMTASAMKGDRERCLEAGMNDYVSKPIAREIFFSTINRWLPPKSQSDGSQPREPERASTPPADLRALETSCDHDPNFLAEVVGAFLSENRQHIDALSAAVSAPDTEAVMREAHAIKSSALMLNAPALAAAAQELEGLGRSGNLRGAKGLFGSLRREFERVEAFVAPLSDGQA
jgi:CheY-like chemotaxis protein